MNGKDVRQRREELQLSRPQLVDRLLNASIGRMTVGILAGIEVRSDEIRAAEVPLYQRALGLDQDGNELETPEDEPDNRTGFSQHSVRKPGWLDPAGEWQPEWCGLKPGTIIKVEGCPRAYFEFRYYYRDSKQEFVSCYGGKRGHEKQRYFRPERIRTSRGRKVC